MLTKREVKIYRLCHHNFSGYTVERAAGILDMSPRRIAQILADIKIKAPQLFPILTRIQARDYHLYVDEGWTMREIAENTDRVKASVQDSIEAAINKGMPRPTRRRREMFRYDESMDNCIKEKF